MSDKRIECSVEVAKGDAITAIITIGPDGSAVGTFSRGDRSDDINWTYRSADSGEGRDARKEIE